MAGTDDGFSTDGANSGDDAHAPTKVSFRPPTAGGKKVFTPSRSNSGNLPVGRVNSLASTCSDPQRRRGSVQALLNQFSNFATDLQETHEIDLNELKKDLNQTVEQIKDLISREYGSRRDGDEVLQKRCDALEKELESLKKQRPSDSEKQRIDQLENMFAAMADKHTREIDSIRKAQDSLSKELVSFNAAHQQHLEVEQSLDTAVKGLTSAAEQTAKALAAAKSKLDHLHENVQSCEQHCISAEHNSQTLTETVKTMETKISIVSERVSKVESAVNKIQISQSQLEGLEPQMKQKLSDINNLINQHAASHNGRLDPLERGHSDLLSRHDGLSRDVKGLKDENKKRSMDLGSLKQHVDNSVGDLAEGTARELKGLRKDIDQTRAAMDQQTENRTTKQKIETLVESVTNIEKHVSVVEKHLTDTEKRLESNIRSCTKDLDNLKGDHDKLSNNVKRGLADTHDRIERQQKGISDVHEDRHSDLLSKVEGQARDLKNLQKHVEGALGDLAQSTARELKATRDDVNHLRVAHDEILPATHSKIDNIQKNVQNVEKRCTTVETTTTKIIQEVHDTEKRVESTIKNHSQVLDDVRNDHGNLSQQFKQRSVDANDLIANHIGPLSRNLEDRHNQLLSKHEDLANKCEGHNKDIRHLWDESGRHGQDLGQLRQDLNHENAKRGQDVNNLRQHLDGALGDLSHNTARELKVTRDDLDQVLALLSGVQRAWRARQKRLSEDGQSSICTSPKKAGYGEDCITPTSAKAKNSNRRSSCLM